MVEYGVFNNEGCLFSGLISMADAEEEAAQQRADGDEHAYAAEMCADHEEQPKATCDDCF
jgi:hypothetical protein